MQMRTRAVLACVAVCFAFCLARPAAAHGILGDRFFPPTIATDDPFAVDELALPTLSWVKNAAQDSSPAFHEFDAGFEFDKEILPHFAIGVSDTYIYQNPDQGPVTQGFSNLTLTAKYQLWWNDEHEAIVSVGIQASLGNTGARDLGDPFSTVGPRLFVGKGMGDLPDSVAAFQPFAITGAFTQNFPVSGAAANTFEWGFAIEYSLPYLQQHVRDIGLPNPFKNMIPLVEFAMTTDENRDQRGLTSGTVNPGVLYENNYFQLGIEANVPINSRSGAHVGITVQMWIYIDDIWPHTFGHPLFGERS
jgi:hypothetical protein